MSTARAESYEAAAKILARNEGARKILAHFYNIYVDQGTLNFCKDSRDAFADVGLAPSDGVPAINHLVERNLLELFARDTYKLTREGVHVSENEDVLDAVLPLAVVHPGDRAAEVAPARPCNVAIVTAIDDETKAILALLRIRNVTFTTEVREERYYYTWTMPTSSGAGVSIVLAQGTSKGSLHAQAVTREIIGQFSPRHIILAGIAGGLEERGVRIGDAIVPSAIFHYEPEKLLKGEDGYRPMPYDCDPFIQRVMQHLAVTGELDAVMGTGKVHYKHYASGDKVLAWSDAPLRKRILDMSADVTGFEMEAPGMLHAVREAYKGKHFAGTVLKCVSDFGDDRMDESKKDGNRKLALERVAQLLLLVLPELMTA